MEGALPGSPVLPQTGTSHREWESAPMALNSWKPPRPSTESSVESGTKEG